MGQREGALCGCHKLLAGKHMVEDQVQRQAGCCCDRGLAGPDESCDLHIPAGVRVLGGRDQACRIKMGLSSM